MKKPNRIKLNQVSMHEIDEEHLDRRIDNFLMSVLPNVPRSRIYKILRSGEVRVNSGRVKAPYRLKIGDKVRVPPVYLEEKTAEKPSSRYSLPVLYEDEYLMIINKPSGLAVHAGSGIRYGVIEQLRAERRDLPYLELVHRLDRETSGCLLLAKKRSVLRNLHDKLRQGEMKKKYYALAYGAWSKKLNRIDAPLLKNQMSGGERIVRVDESGKASCTTFQIISKFACATLLIARPITGRTHQIRVHAAHAGYPLIGDSKYGSKDGNQFGKVQGLRRLFLHAHSLSFVHPKTEEVLEVKAELAAELQQMVDELT